MLAEATQPTLNAISVYELNRRLSDAIATAPGVRNVWVVGETSDVRTSNGHCYLELVEKGDDGANVSRIRANIWANTYRAIRSRFQVVTGADFASGMKVRALVTASYHPAYGMSVTIADIDPAYTAGDAVRRRNEILNRLASEGILEQNRSIKWNMVPNRIAVISARGAAGYGDFMTHLFGNPSLLRFDVDLYAAVMQGDRTVPTVIEAMNQVLARADRYDALVIIRGGGATSDLAAFDDYNLAAAVARFPIPVIIGIGHERDVTVLDFVANTRVKTPTAAAELLVERVLRVYDAFGRAADKIYLAAAERIAANRELLAHAEASLPGVARQTVLRHKSRLERNAMAVLTTVSKAVTARTERLNMLEEMLGTSATRAVERQTERLRRAAELMNALSPDSVIARGFSLTMLADGTVVRSPGQVSRGTTLTTRVAGGTIESEVTEQPKGK